MHLFKDHTKFDGHKVLVTARLVKVEDGKEWHPENYIDVFVPQHATFDVDSNVPRKSLERAVQAALDELKK